MKQYIEQLLIDDIDDSAAAAIDGNDDINFPPASLVPGGVASSLRLCSAFNRAVDDQEYPCRHIGQAPALKAGPREIRGRTNIPALAVTGLVAVIELAVE